MYLNVNASSYFFSNDSSFTFFRLIVGNRIYIAEKLNRMCNNLSTFYVIPETNLKICVNKVNSRYKPHIPKISTGVTVFATK